MTAFFKRFICRLVILSSIVLPYSANTQAAMIGTGQAIANVEAQRAKVKDFVARADAQRKLAALGVGAAAAGERVNALTDDEAQLIAGRIDTLPAGGVGTEVALGCYLLSSTMLHDSYPRYLWMLLALAVAARRLAIFPRRVL